MSSVRALSVVRYTHLLKPNIFKPNGKYPTSTRIFYHVNNRYLHCHGNVNHTGPMPRLQSPVLSPIQILLHKRSISVKQVRVSQQSIRTFFEGGRDGDIFDDHSDADMKEGEIYEDYLDEATDDKEIDSEGEDSPDLEADYGGGEMSMEPLMMGLLFVGGPVVFGFIGFCCVMAVLSVAMGEEECPRQKRHQEEKQNEEERLRN